MSLPVLHTVESTGSLLEDSGGGISFLDLEGKEKGKKSSDSKSYGRSNSNRSNLDAITEEGGGHRNGQVESLWEDSDQSTHSGSETGRRKKPKKGTKKLQLNS